MRPCPLYTPPVAPTDWTIRQDVWSCLMYFGALSDEAPQTLSSRGRWSRNKVSVGEPAEGSLPLFSIFPVHLNVSWEMLRVFVWHVFGYIQDIHASSQPHFQSTSLKPLFLIFHISKKTTSNNGYLGSRIDEDRSEFRYVMRIAELVNHQIVERKLHFL